MEIARALIGGIAFVVLVYALAFILTRWSFTAPYFPKNRRDQRPNGEGFSGSVSKQVHGQENGRVEQ